ncbi:ribonuclease H-like domain-containing protein [Aspergillus crustosus]
MATLLPPPGSPLTSSGSEDGFAAQPESQRRWKKLTIPEGNNLMRKIREAKAWHSEKTLEDCNYRVGTPNTPLHVSASSPNAPNPRKRPMVAIDCEFVGIKEGPSNDASYLGQIVVVDVLRNNLLLDLLVRPPVPITNYRTKYSGLNAEVYRKYANKNQVVDGIGGAVEALFKLIDQDTVIVGHALHNDLNMLGLVHPKCLDTQILARELFLKYVGDGRATWPTWKLRDLCKWFLNIAIQDNQQGHDCYEDTMATRELLLFMKDEKNKKNEAKIKDWVEREKGSRQAWQSRSWVVPAPKEKRSYQQIISEGQSWVM